MDKKLLKNIDKAVVLDMKDLVVYQDGQIVSKTLVQNSAVSMTLFAFDADEEISSHESNGDAMVRYLTARPRSRLEIRCLKCLPLKAS